MTPTAADGGIALQDATHGRSAMILADEPRLAQVLTNLISNALRFTDDGGHVRVELDTLEAHARLRIIDD